MRVYVVITVQPVHKHEVIVAAAARNLVGPNDEHGLAVILHRGECMGRDQVVDLADLVAVHRLLASVTGVILQRSKGRVGDDGVHAARRPQFAGCRVNLRDLVALVLKQGGAEVVELVDVSVLGVGLHQQHAGAGSRLQHLRVAVDAGEAAGDIGQRRGRAVRLVLDAGAGADVQQGLRVVQRHHLVEDFARAAAVGVAVHNHLRGALHNHALQHFLCLLHARWRGLLAVIGFHQFAQRRVVLRHGLGHQVVGQRGARGRARGRRRCLRLDLEPAAAHRHHLVRVGQAALRDVVVGLFLRAEPLAGWHLLRRRGRRWRCGRVSRLDRVLAGDLRHIHDGVGAGLAARHADICTLKMLQRHEVGHIVAQGLTNLAQREAGRVLELVIPEPESRVEQARQHRQQLLLLLGHHRGAHVLAEDVADVGQRVLEVGLGAQGVGVGWRRGRRWTAAGRVFLALLAVPLVIKGRRAHVAHGHARVT